ncbi:unnamed protein product [Rotaria sordida]|uniref:Uncharacterized protein n=1 Tax=Rotaria sordida TaxID=392033 RepID=A0A814DQ59_9BILA|nr:unnamed protein product [Rotaria sordida]CAF3829881.1 unnamed protein product [Rotaria sordida]
MVLKTVLENRIKSKAIAREVPCPLTDGRINLRGYDQPIESNIPCRHHKIPFSALKSHFRHYHHVSDAFAQDPFD